MKRLVDDFVCSLLLVFRSSVPRTAHTKPVGIAAVFSAPVLETLDIFRSLFEGFGANQYPEVAPVPPGGKRPMWSFAGRSYVQSISDAGIRVQVFSSRGEKQTRTLGALLGLETGWNSLICKNGSTILPKSKQRVSSFACIDPVTCAHPGRLYVGSL